MDSFNFLNQLAEAQKKLNSVITPEVLKEMTPEQRKAVKEGQMAFKLKEGQSYSERVLEIQKILSDAKL